MTTLFEAAGGQDAFLALATAHHARCLADPELNHPFSHDDNQPDHVERLAAYWAQVMGGPPTYTERFGSEPEVLRMHSGNGDISDLGARFVVCFDAAVDDAAIPDDPALRARLHDYMVWAVDRVLALGDPDAVPASAPLPRWGWDGPEG